MKKFLLTILLFAVISPAIFSQNLASYYERNLFLSGAAGAFNEGLLGAANPANVAMLQKFNFRYYWLSDVDEGNLFAGQSSPDAWGIFTAVPGLGFSVVRETDKFFSRKSQITNYHFTLAHGNRTAALGFAYTRTTGDKRRFVRENLFSIGGLWRPDRHFSLGIIGSYSSESDEREGVLELGIRPFGTNRLTLFADNAWQRDSQFTDVPWSIGAAVEAVPGLAISGRYFDSEAFTLGVNFSFGSSGFSAQTHFNSRQKRVFNTYSTGFGETRANLFTPFFRKKNYIALRLKGRVDYQKYQWFDSNTQRFLDILQHVRNAKNDPRVSVIALNLSAMRILPEHAWELREALREAKTAGKKVIIFIDNAGMTNYHLASVADRVMMDPMGNLMLPGYRFGRSYLKGTLEKMGLGFDEWRFFKYKSAAEALSREKMSEADREQSQDLADGFYETARREISESRKISTEQFDHLIDNHVYFMAEDALQQELVDTLCRWNDLDKVIKSLTGRNKMKLPLRMLTEDAEAYQNWGEPPVIAVVYGLGECAMDTGIRARWLDSVFRGLAKNKSVKAVVFRVDSPGGDGMASDVVAEALKVCAKEKPVVISQGQLAASGGYWISMYGDTILAGPTTLTGSIGVIAGWVYDKGFSEKLGMTSDLVKRGKHADLGYGVTLPLLGIRVPARNLTEEERSRAAEFIRDYYDIFVKKVAAGRNLPEADVREIAQGRVWTGAQGNKNGLVDGIGGLQPAIDLARKMAKISSGDKYLIKEFPKFKGLFNTNFFSPVSVKKQLSADPAIRFIKLMGERPGYPLPMLLPGEYPVLE